MTSSNIKRPGFVSGIQYFIRGFGLIKVSGVRRFVIIPFLINLTLFAGALWFGIDTIMTWVKEMQIQITADSEEGMQWLNNIIKWLSWVIIPLFVLAFMAMTFYTFTLIANLIAAPFNSLLAEKIEAHLAGNTPTGNGNMMEMIKDIGGSFASELRKLMYFVIRAIPLAILSALSFAFPPLGLVTGFLWFLFSAWMLSIEYSDYPMGNHAMRFPDQRRTLKENRLFALGFGTGVTAATMIPFVNFIAMPVAVAGATAMWVDHWRSNIPQIEVK